MPDLSMSMFASVADFEQARDAARWRAIKTRHAYRIIRTLVDPDGGGYSSAQAPALLDAWADAAAQDVAEWDAKTPEEQEEHFRAEIERLQAAAALGETQK